MRASTPRGRIGGLRAQLLLTLVALLVLTLALVAVATLQFHKRHLQQAVADEAQRHAAWLADLDAIERQAAADALRQQPGVLHVGPLPEGGDHDIDASQNVQIASFDETPAIWAHHSASPDVVVVLSLADAQSSIDAGRRALLVFLISTLLFVTVVGYGFFSWVVIRPLRALGVATSRAAEGDLASPITVLPRNEFGDVGRQFNAMLERLDDQRAELEQQLEQLQQAHRDLQQAQDSLIRSEKLASVGHLAAGVAHEVGNPLAAVMGYTDLLADRSLDESDADELAERMKTQLKRIRQIIRQLLDYSRADSENEPAPTDAAECIDEALHLVQATPAGRDVDIDVDVADDLPPIFAVGGEAVQVLVNLLLNAVEAMDDADASERRLTVGAATDDDHVVVDIIDTGPGVDEAIAEQIFDPFFTTSEPGDGTGLGLAIAHRLVNRVDGELLLVDDGSNAPGAHFQLRWKRAGDC